MKRGDVFLHRHWLDADRAPLRCTVTVVRQGWVFWKQEGERKAYLRFRVEDADKYVLPNTEALRPAPAGTQQPLVGNSGVSP